MRLRRHCYNKMHRCPCWAGGGWRMPKRPRDCSCDSSLDINWGTKPRWQVMLEFHRCKHKACNVIAIPYITRFIDPTYAWWHIEYKLSTRVTTIKNWFNHRYPRRWRCGEEWCFKGSGYSRYCKKHDRGYVHHKPVWEPAALQVDAEGNTKPGFICTHELENGMGPCGSNVFVIEDDDNFHTCIVRAN